LFAIAYFVGTNFYLSKKKITESIESGALKNAWHYRGANNASVGIEMGQAVLSILSK